MSDDPLPRLRALCLALPETTERVSHGEPAWFVRDKKLFVSYADHHPDDGLGFWCAAAPGVQEALVGSDPQRFHPPPHGGHRGWPGANLGAEQDWDEVARHVPGRRRGGAP